MKFPCIVDDLIVDALFVMLTFKLFICYVALVKGASVAIHNSTTVVYTSYFVCDNCIA